MSPTPILDRQQAAPVPKPRRKVHFWRWSAVGAVVGLALGLVWGHSLDPIMGPLPMVFAGFFGGLFCGILLHELGHLVAGLAVGFEFRRMLVGPLLLTKELRGFRFSFVGNRLLAGGHVFMVPRSMEHLRRDFAIFVAGGPLATAIVFLPIAFLPWGSLAGSLLVANLLLAFNSWVPREIRGHYTDAKNFQILSRQGPAAERLIAVLYLTALDGLGTPPGQWPPHVVARLATPGGDRAYRSGGSIFLHLYARETASPAEVAGALEKVLALAGGLRGDLRRAYFAKAAFWQAVDNRNATLARAWLDDARAVQDAVTQKDWDAAALAAIAMAEGDATQFHQQLTRALAYLDRQPGPSGCVAAERNRLLALGSGF